MKAMVIITAAQEHRPFYALVGRALAERGHEVEYVLDSHYTDYLHPDVPLDGRVHYFSDYFRANKDRVELPARIAVSTTGRVLFPDVDRMAHTRFLTRSEAGYYDAWIANLAHFFVDRFTQCSFDVVVYENVSNAFSYMAYEVARSFGAKYIGLAASRMPGRLDVLDRAWARDSRLEATFRDVRDGRVGRDAKVRDYVRDYLEHLDAKVPDYVKNPHPFHMGLLQRYAKSRTAARFLRSVWYRVSNADDFHYAAHVADPLFVFPEQLGREVVRQLKRRVLDRTLYAKTPELERPYFVYPLQFHPESSASVDGSAFNDEWSNIMGIVQNLPFGVALYVKDHKHAAGRQPLEFYQRLSRTPHVTLVHPDYDTKQLLRNASAVVCNTSTMGFEALLLGKPVYVLGHPFYEFFPTCVPIRTFDGASELFARHREIKAEPSDIEALLAAYYLCSTEGTLDVLKQFRDPSTADWIASVIETAARGN